MSKRYLPPELEGNYCHIAPEWERGTGQRLWFVSAPYGGTILRFKGEPTSLLYAIAPLIEEIRKADRGEESRIHGLNMSDVALINPTVASEKLYLELEKRLLKQNLRAICIGTLTASSPEARKIAELAKRVNPATVTIFGGPHEDDIGLKTAVDPVFDGIADFSVAGDGEYALLQLAELMFGNPDATPEELKSLVLEHQETFRSCPGRGGVYFRRRDQAHQLLLSQKMLDLNLLPFMPRELLHEVDTRTFSVFKKGGWNVKTAQVMTHRGCAWHCSFCSESAALNLRTVESVMAEIEEIKHFKERHPHLDRENYEAIFFDDSTFTTRSRRRIKFLEELFARLEHSGLEWGCQTRLDQIDEDVIHDMKEAGCTYVFTGLESASDEMLKAMTKGQGRENVEKAFEAINKVGMRMGVSLIFGVADHKSDKTPETHATIMETISFVKQQTEKGNIILVSPNIATYYPDTAMTSDLLQVVDTSRMPDTGDPSSGLSGLDFRHPLVNRGYPWNRFEEGESYHPKGIERQDAEFIIEECIKHFGEFLVSQDIYAFDEYQEAYRNGALDEANLRCVDLNHAAISRPPVQVRAVSEHTAEILRYFAPASLMEKADEARRLAALLMGLAPERSENILLARNTTEAASFAFWMAGLYAEQGAKVLCSNAENLSILRIFRLHMDHGNPHGRDLWSAFQDFGARESIFRPDKKLIKELNLYEVDVLGTDRPEAAILSQVRAMPGTRLIVFSHVIRDNGYIVNVKWLCEAIREIIPEVYIVVDGAQALGALPAVEVESLGCDFYVGTPHKTLGSFPLGLLYFNDRAKENLHRIPFCSSNPEKLLPCVLKDGMLSRTLKIEPNVDKALSLPEIESFKAIVRFLGNKGLVRGHNCWLLDHHRRKLKEAFIEGLKYRFPYVEITSPLDGRHSNFVLTFRFPGPGEDNRLIVERLWEDHQVFVSYIARSNVIRASFGPMNTEEDVEKAVDAVRDVHARVMGAVDDGYGYAQA